MQDETEEQDPIYSSLNRVNPHEHLHPALILILALFAIRYSPPLLRKRLGKMFLYFHRLCALAILSWPSIQEIFYRFGNKFNLNSNLDFLEITEVNFGIGILLPLTYIWLIYAFFAGKFEKNLSADSSQYLTQEEQNQEANFNRRTFYLSVLLVVSILLSMIGSTLYTIDQMDIKNPTVIIIILITCSTSAIFACAPLATSIFISLICLRLTNHVKQLSSHILEGRMSLAAAKAKHLEIYSSTIETSAKLRWVLIVWFASLIPCVVVFTGVFFTEGVELISPIKNVALLLILLLLMIWMLWSCTTVNTEYKRFVSVMIHTISEDQITQSNISKESFARFISFLEKIKIKFNIFGLTVNRKLWSYLTGSLLLLLLVILQQYLLILPNSTSYYYVP